jgi:hypothetical protein
VVPPPANVSWPVSSPLDTAMVSETVSASQFPAPGDVSGGPIRLSVFAEPGTQLRQITSPPAHAAKIPAISNADR